MATSVDIAGTLGVGSGINTTQLVSDLVSATFDPKTTAVGTKQTTNNARISALASAKSSLTTFSNALTELLKSSDYAGKPASNDPSVASVSLIPGSTETPKGLPAQLEVKQLASAQVIQSSAIAASTTVVGAGKLSFAVGSTSFDVTMTDANSTLDDLAKAINTAGKGITASVVTDNSGARLVLKGQTGGSNAFTVTTTDANLSGFAFGGSNVTGAMQKTQTAQNSKIAIDNIDMEFATNEVTTAIPNLRISLNKATPGSTVTLATDQPTTTMSDLVGEFVQAYNNLRTAITDSTKSTDTTVGLLSSDSGVREMSLRLAKLTSTPLTNTGTYRTLSDLGVTTNRDGTLTLDSKVLSKALADDPAGVTQMLNPTVSTTDKPGIAGVMKSMNDYLNGTNGPLASSAKVYDNMKASLQKQVDKLSEQKTNYSAQLTKTYSAMQTQLLSIKATQSYLTQQISVWTNSNN